VSTNPQVPSSVKRATPAERLINSPARNWRIAIIGAVILLLVASTLVTLFVLARQNTVNTNAAPAAKVVGHVYFLSSGRLYVNNNQGISDEVLVDLHNIPPPAPGKSYYGWLLGDANQSDVPWVPLGELSVNQGIVHSLYPGDSAHTNLLNDMSRFVITEANASTAPTSPLIDQSTWRYYGEIYQLPSVKDPNHFSLLDHLRHLLVQAPELKALGLPGGLSIWLVRNVEVISNWALSARISWETHNTARMRQLLTNILYYLDGECTQQDLQGILPGTPTTPENVTIAHISHFALLNPCVQEEQEQANALKQVFQHVPHNYVDHLIFHMAGVIQSQGATGDLHTLAVQINTAINNVKNWLGQIHQDAIQLIHMSDDQLNQLSALDILSDLDSQARYAYAGQTDPITGNIQEGSTWIYDNVERLSTMNVQAYSPK
jgi:hypothetical protein